MNSKATRSVTCGVEGVDFQLNIIAWTLLKAHRLYKGKYAIYSEMTEAGKFDDVVLIYKDTDDKEHYRFLQAKHVRDEAKKSISFKDLTIGNKFNILKYFESFKDIVGNEKFQDKVQDVILFSNLDINNEVLPYVDLITDVDPIFHFDQEKINHHKPQFYKFKSNFIETFRSGILRDIASALLDNCGQGSDNIGNFKDYHGILLKEVIDIDRKRFRSEFINRQNIVCSITGIFRDLFEEEILKRHNGACVAIEWMQNAQFNLHSSFGRTGGVWPPIFDMDNETALFNNFCDKLKLAFNQPNEHELNAYLIAENKLNVDILELKDELRVWFKDYNYPLNDDFIHEVLSFSEIIKSKQELLQQHLEFNSDSIDPQLSNFLNLKQKKILQMRTNVDIRATSLKLQCTLMKQSKNSFLCTPPRLSKNELKNILKLFSKSQRYDLLIWETHHCPIDFDLLKDIRIQNLEEKKIIIVCDDKFQMNAVDVGLDEKCILRIDDETKYDHLSDATKKRLESKMVEFQGQKIQLNQLYTLTNVSWTHLLTKDIVVGAKINVGAEYITNNYIHRTMITQRPYFHKSAMQQKHQQFHFALNRNDFDKKKQQNPGNIMHLFGEQNDNIVWQKSSPGGLKQLRDFKLKTIQKSFSDNNSDLFNEFDAYQKVLILTDPAGMGKTMASSHLAKEFKRQHPYHWVIRLVGMECAPILNHITDSDQIDELTVLNQLHKLESPLEKFLFRQYIMSDVPTSRLILIFDGYDEISEHCQRIIVRVLKYLSEKPNVRLIGITTRPRYQEQLEQVFQQIAYTLTPFSEENKIDFLVNFWKLKINPDPDTSSTSDSDALRTFAGELIEIIEAISDDDLQLTGIPLRMRMLGEIYADQARILMEGGTGAAPDLLSFSIYDLYEQFINLRMRIFATEKTPQMRLAIGETFTKVICIIQSLFARSVVLGTSVDNELAEVVIYLGLVQQHEDGRYHFIHRTFAEFLTAQYLLDKYLTKANQSVAEKLGDSQLAAILVDENLLVVRMFINCKINHTFMIDQLRNYDLAEINKYFKKKYEKALRLSAKENTNEILKFILDVWLLCKPIKMPDYFHQTMHDFIGFMDNSRQFNINNYSCFVKDLLETPSSLSVFLDWMLAKWRNSHNEILVKMLYVLMQYILTKERKHNEQIFDVLIKYQSELEKIGLLEDEQFKDILFHLNNDRRWNTKSVKYLRYLQSKPNCLLYEFLKKNKKFARLMIIRGGENLSDFLSMLKEDPIFLSDYFYDILIVDYKTYLESLHFDVYTSLIYRHIKDIGEEKREELKMDVIENLGKLTQYEDVAINCIKFCSNIRNILPFEDILAAMKVNKNLSLIVNCVLWGFDTMLKYILDAGEDIEAPPIELTRSEDLSTETAAILNHIRTRSSGDDFGHILASRNSANESILSFAIRRADQRRINVFSSWIDSEINFGKLFKNMEFLQIDMCTDFVFQRFPQYKMKFFEINKEYVIADVSYYDIIFNILNDDEKIEPDEFVKICHLQNDKNDDTILHVIIGSKDRKGFKKWFNLLKRKCSRPSDVLTLFQIRNKRNETPIDMLRLISVAEERKAKAKLLEDFFKDHDLNTLRIHLKWTMARRLFAKSK